MPIVIHCLFDVDSLTVFFRKTRKYWSIRKGCEGTHPYVRELWLSSHPVAVERTAYHNVRGVNGQAGNFAA